ncbi:hypothetical protein F5888DRAFT_1889474 [Russula emetica]|nr:hypothetical protein F5888DRAFT_1889474 [Russula emetica]
MPAIQRSCVGVRRPVRQCQRGGGSYSVVLLAMGKRAVGQRVPVTNHQFRARHSELRDVGILNDDELWEIDAKAAQGRQQGHRRAQNCQQDRTLVSPIPWVPDQSFTSRSTLLWRVETPSGLDHLHLFFNPELQNLTLEVSPRIPHISNVASLEWLRALQLDLTGRTRKAVDDFLRHVVALGSGMNTPNSTRSCDSGVFSGEEINFTKIKKSTEEIKEALCRGSLTGEVPTIVSFLRRIASPLTHLDLVIEDAFDKTEWRNLCVLLSQSFGDSPKSLKISAGRSRMPSIAKSGKLRTMCLSSTIEWGASVGDRVAGVDGRVKDVDDKVRAVDDKFTVVVYYLQSTSFWPCLRHGCSQA